MLRFRTVLLGIVGIGLLVFAISYFVYRFIFKKDFKNMKINILMILLAVIGGTLFYSPAKQYIQLKKGTINHSNVVTYNGQKIRTEANATERLTLPSVYGSIEATHPSVVALDKPLDGYKYWMAVTPYPKGKAIYENPHVFKSNDLVSWIPNEANPLDEPKSEKFNDNNTPMQYDSDTHIIYNKKKNQLEVFWRYVDDINKKSIIYKRTSVDGKNWTPKEIVFDGTKPGEDWISPVFIKDDKGYKVWYVAHGYKIWTRDSQDGKKWSNAIEVKVPYEEKNMHHWHLDVQKTDLGYEMVVVGFKSNGEYKLSDRHVMNVYYSKSEDNKKWDTLKPIIFPSGKRVGFDGKGLYRSAMLKEGKDYYIFYSGIGYDDTRGVGVSTGTDINHLKGLNLSDYQGKIKLDNKTE